MKVLIALPVSACVLIAGLAVGVLLRDRALSEVAPAESSGGQALGLGATPSPTVPTCEALAAIPAALAPPLEVTDLGNGTKRITSAEGGYSLVVPGSWHVRSSILGTGAAFGQAHIRSYDPKTLDARHTYPAGMVPPEIGIGLDIQVWTNSAGEMPDRFVSRVRIGPDQSAVRPGSSIELAGQQAYRTTILDEHRFQPADAPLVVTRQTRLLWLVPTLRPDRMLVAYATPGESSLVATAEQTVATLELSQPAVAMRPLTRPREEVLRQWLYDKAGALIPGRRAEAKLLTYAEARAAMSPGGGLLRIDRDPDELFWLVAVSGPDLPQGRGGGPRLGGPAATRPPTAWILYQSPATNDRFEMTGTIYATTGTWPPGFDALPDRCR